VIAGHPDIGPVDLSNALLPVVELADADADPVLGGKPWGTQRRHASLRATASPVLGAGTHQDNRQATSNKEN
jgi:hypothetical protein